MPQVRGPAPPRGCISGGRKTSGDDCGRRRRPGCASLGAAGGRPEAGSPSPGRLARLKAWFLPFLAFFGLYASSSVCVFCGGPGCPVGAGAAAVAGGFFAAVWQWGRGRLSRLTLPCRQDRSGGQHVAAERQKL